MMKPLGIVALREIGSKMRAPALFPSQRPCGDDLSQIDHQGNLVSVYQSLVESPGPDSSRYRHVRQRFSQFS
jgi:hypothetical protein